MATPQRHNTRNHCKPKLRNATYEHYTEVRPQVENGPSLKTLPCKAENCRRCMSLQGGYQFRWHDARWVELHIRLKRDVGCDLADGLAADWRPVLDVGSNKESK